MVTVSDMASLTIDVYAYNFATMQPIYMPCYCGSIRQAARTLTQMYDHALMPSGLKITQFGILRLLSAYPRLTTGDVASALVMDSTTVTRSLKTIHESGWIARVSGQDRRERRWTVTPAGNDRLEQALPLWKKVQRELAETARGVDLRALNQTVFKLVQTLET